MLSAASAVKLCTSRLPFLPTQSRQTSIPRSFPLIPPQPFSKMLQRIVMTLQQFIFTASNKAAVTTIQVTDLLIISASLSVAIASFKRLPWPISAILARRRSRELIHLSLPFRFGPIGRTQPRNHSHFIQLLRCFPSELKL